MRILKNIAGRRYGKLTVVRPIGQEKSGAVIWECMCDCGMLHNASISQLNNGHVQSCGCLQIECATKHGGNGTRLYRVWGSMKGRCNRPKDKRYKEYGGRGIRVCAEWEHDFAAFREWALANGYKEDAPKGTCTIDRINVDGDYSPDNCRFVSKDIQANNKRNNRLLTINGEMLTLAQWSKKTGLGATTIRERLCMGWDAERAVYTPCGRCIRG